MLSYLILSYLILPNLLCSTLLYSTLFITTPGSGIVFSEGTPYSQTERISIGRELFGGLVSPSTTGASGSGAGFTGNGGDDDVCAVVSFNFIVL
jgi:hypothetical protein